MLALVDDQTQEMGSLIAANAWEGAAARGLGGLLSMRLASGLQAFPYSRGKD